MNVIFGAGGFAREVGWIMDELVRLKEASRIDAFVASDGSSNIGKSIHGAKIIAESAFFHNNCNTPISVYIAVGSPQLRQHLHQKCLVALNRVKFPPLIHPSVMRDLRPGAVTLGCGAIVCAGTILTTDVQIGDFVHLNLNCTVGHDTVIGAFSTLSPGVHISGRVNLGRGCFVGTGAVILENISAPDTTVIGAGATVVKTISEPGIYVGTPARLRS